MSGCGQDLDTCRIVRWPIPCGLWRMRCVANPTIGKGWRSERGQWRQEAATGLVLRPGLDWELVRASGLTLRAEAGRIRHGRGKNSRPPPRSSRRRVGIGACRRRARGETDAASERPLSGERRTAPRSWPGSCHRSSRARSNHFSFLRRCAIDVLISALNVRPQLLRRNRKSPTAC